MGWSYDEVLPYFRRSEDFEDGASQYHGAGGPQDGSGRAVGVEMSRDGVISQLRAGGDVILSGGVIGSAQLMLLSGIGAAEDLRTLDIPVRADLPGVGANLHDHILTTVVWGKVAAARPRLLCQQARGAAFHRERPGDGHPGPPAADVARPAAGGRIRRPR